MEAAWETPRYVTILHACIIEILWILMWHSWGFEWHWHLWSIITPSFSRTLSLGFRNLSWRSLEFSHVMSSSGNFFHLTRLSSTNLESCFTQCVSTVASGSMMKLLSLKIGAVWYWELGGRWWTAWASKHGRLGECKNGKGVSTCKPLAQCVLQFHMAHSICWQVFGECVWRRIVGSKGEPWGKPCYCFETQCLYVCDQLFAYCDCWPLLSSLLVIEVRHLGYLNRLQILHFYSSNIWKWILLRRGVLCVYQCHATGGSDYPT